MYEKARAAWNKKAQTEKNNRKYCVRCEKFNDKCFSKNCNFIYYYCSSYAPYRKKADRTA